MVITDFLESLAAGVEEKQKYFKVSLFELQAALEKVPESHHLKMVLEDFAKTKVELLELTKFLEEDYSRILNHLALLSTECKKHPEICLAARKSKQIAKELSAVQEAFSILHQSVFGQS